MKQKPKGTIFKVQSIAIANPLYIDLIHKCLNLKPQHIVRFYLINLYFIYTS